VYSCSLARRNTSRDEPIKEPNEKMTRRRDSPFRCKAAGVSPRDAREVIDSTTPILVSTDNADERAARNQMTISVRIEDDAADSPR